MYDRITDKIDDAVEIFAEGDYVTASKMVSVAITTIIRIGAAFGV